VTDVNRQSSEWLEAVRAHSVLIAEESDALRELLSNWLPGVDTHAATSVSELHAAFDATVAVAILSETVVDESATAVKTRILRQNPYCQLVGVVPRSASVMPHEERYDELIQRPVFKEEFQETVEYRLVAGTYSNLVSEMFDLNSTILALEQATADEVSERDEKLDTLQARYDALDEQLSAFQAHLSHDTLVKILRTNKRHSEFLAEPSGDSEEETTDGKYRPQRCPSCRLPWDVDHRNDLGVGYTQLGADVYQCTRCNAVIHGLAGDQRVY